MSQQSTNLITEGILVSNLHYGVFVRNWWVQKSIKNSNNQILPIPYRLYMRVTCKLNEKSTEIMTSASAAINTLYQEIFGRKTEYSGSIIMGFYNNNIVEKLVKDVIFFPLFISIESFSVVITKSKIIAQYQGETPNNVWKKTGINKKFEGNDLFGIMYPVVQSILQQFPNDFRICTPNEWNNSDFLQQAFDQHIKSRKIITSILLDWKKLFDDWLLQKSTIIQIPKMLQKIYPIDYQLQDKEIRAWKAMFKACGCNNVTPFEKDISNIEFWSKALDSSGDQETLINLYNAGLIQLEKKKEITSEIEINYNEIFWESFRFALKNNKRGIDGKIRVLSIIADKFRYQDLREKLQMG
ncbi:hypothetical protein Glove_682g66 [Diversispora epigaea]|uniref:Uncharacterized protein n=1 Tax=Diversispora epigaea TaxID=1348612 RepID=A0A397G6J8_9GLOM|nr:hypothetical protein Glove_682g66 [Diversispora epigaea]